MRGAILGLLITAVCTVTACASASADQGPANVRQKICLNGVWDFKAAGTSDTEIPKDDWATLRVPSSWFVYGPDNFIVSKADQQSSHAWFKRSFVVPADWADGRKVKLLFLCLDWGYSVYVNGQLAASSDNMRVCFQVDITSLVKFGAENEVAVMTRKHKTTPGHNVDKEGGILRSVYLLTVPSVHMEYSHAIPSVKEKTLTVKTRVLNEDTVAQAVTVQPVVLDNGREELVLPTKTVDVGPGQSVEVETSAPWKDPVIWGFGRYGTPYLYHLKTTMGGKDVTDVRFDRFGFREFGIRKNRPKPGVDAQTPKRKTSARTEQRRAKIAEQARQNARRRTKFVLNGKPIFIKGDLIGRAWPFIENPNFVTAFYQGMRSANVNFQRLHSAHRNTFDSHYWYQVGDELGHLVEAQNMATIPRTWKPDDPRNIDVWGSYVNYHFNHPSLVMWCPDNESIHPNAIPEGEKNFPPWNRLVSYLRELDSTRVVDMHHGYSLFAGVQMGAFDRDNFMTFNIHPYGNLVGAIEREKRSMGFDETVPTLVGEIYSAPSSVGIDIVADPVASFVEQKRRADFWRIQIPILARYGVGGTVLCAMQSRAFVGHASKDEVHFGPWSDRMMVRDETAPGKPLVGTRMGHAKVRWPSLSGEGTKAQFIGPVCGNTGRDGGYGHNINWFDSTVPVFYPAIADKVVGKAYGAIQGPEPKLGPERASEVVVCFGIDGKPIESAYVYLVPSDGQAPPPSAVATDADGTAWFHLWDTGTYRAVAWHDGQVSEAKFTIDARPKLTDKAGYDHVTWVDLGGIDIEKRKAELASPAEFTSNAVHRPDELLYVGSMEHREANGSIPSWWIAAPASESKIVKSGEYSGKVTGNDAYSCGRIKMEPGQAYKVSGWIYKGGGNSYGCFGIKTGDYKWLVKLDGSTTPGEWNYVEKEYVADGSETYFYCVNYYMGDKGVCYFDDLSIRKLSKKTKKQTPKHTFRPGPFKPNADGFITDWLACGPFPNVEIETEEGIGFHGHRTDLLEAYGGEVNITPEYGVEYKVTFPAKGPWLAGEDVVAWRDLHSTESIVSLKNVALPSRGITAGPPSSVCAYVACTVEPSEPRRVAAVKLAVGSDDGYKLWLNGKLVGQLEDCRAAAVDQEVYPVRLVKGENRILLKVFQSVGGWAFCVRFLDSQDKPIKDLTVTLTGEDAE